MESQMGGAGETTSRTHGTATPPESDVFAGFLEAAPDGVILVDTNGVIVRVNARTEALFGYDRAELVGQPIEMLVPSFVRAADVAQRTAHTAAPSPRAMASGRELRGRRRDGTEFAAEVSLSALATPDGPVICSTVRDVTDTRRAAAQYRALIDSVEDAVIEESLDGIVTMWNPGAARIFGYSAGEMIGQPFVKLCLPGRVAEHEEILRRVGAGERVSRSDLVRVRKDGREILVAVTASPIRDLDGRVISQSKVIRDVTEEKRAEIERTQFFELSIDLLCTAGTDGYFRRLNPAFHDVLGWELGDLTARPFVDFVHADDVASTLAEVAKLAGGQPTVRFENRYRCKDGSYKWLSWRAMPSSDGTIYAVARDVTTEKATELALRSSVKEKEVLLQEVHHRVKNNLQVIASLINMQVRKLENEAARDALEECKSRVLAIALIHEKLYQSKDYARVPFFEYLRALCANVFHATGVSPSAARLELDIDPIAMPVDKAIPCGLIVNELITNALKHAFPAEQSGLIRVGLSTCRGEILLRVDDDGVGLPAQFDPATSQTLGLQLVTILCEQLDARLEMRSNDPGASFRVTFELEAK